jgi:hypothetical protein
MTAEPMAMTVMITHTPARIVLHGHMAIAEAALAAAYTNMTTTARRSDR